MLGKETVKLREVSTKRSTELRLLTAIVYFKALNGDLGSIRDFDPQTPVIPATAHTPLAELCADARIHFNNGASQVMIPFISPGSFTLSVVTLNHQDVNALDRTTFQSSAALLEIHTPKRSWSLKELYGDDNEGLERLSRSFSKS